MEMFLNDLEDAGEGLTLNLTYNAGTKGVYLSKYSKIGSTILGDLSDTSIYSKNVGDAVITGFERIRIFNLYEGGTNLRAKENETKNIYMYYSPQHNFTIYGVYRYSYAGRGRGQSSIARSGNYNVNFYITEGELERDQNDEISAEVLEDINGKFLYSDNGRVSVFKGVTKTRIGDGKDGQGVFSYSASLIRLTFPDFNIRMALYKTSQEEFLSFTQKDGSTSVVSNVHVIDQSKAGKAINDDSIDAAITNYVSGEVTGATSIGVRQGMVSSAVTDYKTAAYKTAFEDGIGEHTTGGGDVVVTETGIAYNGDKNIGIGVIYEPVMPTIAIRTGSPNTQLYSPKKIINTFLDIQCGRDLTIRHKGKIIGELHSKINYEFPFDDAYFAGIWKIQRNVNFFNLDNTNQFSNPPMMVLEHKDNSHFALKSLHYILLR